MIRNILYITIIFGMLSALAACQKIDEAAIEALINTDNTPKEPENEDTGDDDDDDADNTGTTPSVTPSGLTIPFITTDGHLAACRYVEGSTADSLRLLLVSITQWYDICSAYSDDPTEATDIARTYVEKNLTSWRIPTIEDATMLEDAYACPFVDIYVYGDNLKKINALLHQLGGDELSPWEAKTNAPSYKYLCKDATYTFALKKGSIHSRAGAKRTYPLRLVRDTVIAVTQ